MSKSNVRVRFAPSPTGPLHMGGVRTALYNYLFARKEKGTFIVRIEDTDQTRYVDGAEKYILESLKWCGISPDEGPGIGGDFGPYRQSERKAIYKEYTNHLIERGHAYYAFDTAEELNAAREQAKAAKMPNWQYNNITRGNMKNSLSLSADEVEERLKNGDPYVIRIKMPRNEEVRFHDEIRGWVAVNTNNLDDKVLFKSDGMPTYHMANIVDDHLMEISHVIRGEEWLPSAPLHVLLYRYMGWEETMPKFAHLPLILKPDGNGKLSKRDGDRLGFPVFPLEWKDPATGNISAGYREEGYFANAFINMLLMLGWNPGTPQEVFTHEEMIEQFSLERVGKAGAKFDPDKTRWFNQQYLRQHSGMEMAELLLPLLRDKGYNEDLNFTAKVCELMSERAYFIKDILDEGYYFYQSPENYDQKAVKKKWKENSAEIITDLAAEFEALGEFSSENLENGFKSFLERKDLGFGKVGPILRIVLTGGMTGPSVFDIAALIGKKESLKRMRNGAEKLG